MTLIQYARKASMNISTTQEEWTQEALLTGRREFWGARVFLLDAFGAFMRCANR